MVETVISGSTKTTEQVVETHLAKYNVTRAGEYISIQFNDLSKY